MKNTLFCIFRVGKLLFYESDSSRFFESAACLAEKEQKPLLNLIFKNSVSDLQIIYLLCSGHITERFKYERSFSKSSMTLDQSISSTEYGAARKVPESMFLLKIGGCQYLIDCGSNHEKEIDEKALPFNAQLITHTFLTHSHMDHVGEVDNLFRSGFSGRFYSTHLTADLTRMQIFNKGIGIRIYNNSIRGKKITSGPKKGQWIPFKKNISEADLKNLMSRFESYDDSHLGYPYNQPIKISDEVEITFYEAGHIPGSAQILININHQGKKTKILTAVDLGRLDYKITNHPIADIPIIRFPHTEFPKDIDYVVMESTNGAREHQSLEKSIEILEESIRDAYTHKGKLIIPIFSIMRPMILRNFLYNLHKANKLPPDFMFNIGSPSIPQADQLITEHLECMDEKAKKDFANKDYNPIKFERLAYIDKRQELIDLLIKQDTPYGIIASSGMCDFGRIVLALEHGISDPKNIILLTGYTAPGTRGYLLQNKEKRIPFGDKILDLKADVRKMGGMSGHADWKEIVAHLKHIKDPAKGEQFKGIFLKHGDSGSCEALKGKLIEAGYKPETVIIMEKGEEYFL